MILIAGPCVIEKKKILKKSVESLLKSIENKDIEFYFKSSFKKDNRTLTTGFSGLDPTKAIMLLNDIKNEYNIKICTDIHETKDFERYDLHNVDIIQIPAYLAKQQSLLKEAASFCNMHGLKLHIKKPQFAGPIDMLNIAKNAWSYGANDIIITDRGTMLGYDKVFMDPRHVDIMKKSGFPVLCDITHPNKNYPGDKLKNIEILAKSYLAAGADGIFMETHPDCENALCDAETMLPLENVDKLIKDIYEI